MSLSKIFFRFQKNLYYIQLKLTKIFKNLGMLKFKDLYFLYSFNYYQYKSIKNYQVKSNRKSITKIFKNIYKFDSRVKYFYKEKQILCLYN